MKNKYQYILLACFLSICSMSVTHASSDKSETTQGGSPHTTQHPPHDHHETDHIKKLDEGMHRRRRDEKKSTN